MTRMPRHIMFLSAAFLLIALVTPLAAERGDDTKRVSKNGHASGTVDGVEITLEYGRPNVKGREIWGELVPYGEIWRTGANEATTISFSSDVTIEGAPLAAGTYGLFTVPGESEWEIVFNTVADQWGSMRYDASKDALRVTVTPAKSDFVETLTFGIGDGKVGLHWENLGVAFGVSPSR